MTFLTLYIDVHVSSIHVMLTNRAHALNCYEVLSSSISFLPSNYHQHSHFNFILIPSNNQSESRAYIIFLDCGPPFLVRTTFPDYALHKRHTHPHKFRCCQTLSNYCDYSLHVTINKPLSRRLHLYVVCMRECVSS